MKSVSLVIACGCLISMNADTTSDLITAKDVWGPEYTNVEDDLLTSKEIWEPEYSAAPSSVDNDDYYYDDKDDKKSEPWPSRKPRINDGTGTSPSLFEPKAGKDVFEPPEG